MRAKSEAALMIPALHLRDSPFPATRREIKRWSTDLLSQAEAVNGLFSLSFSARLLRMDDGFDFCILMSATIP
jgi:hypothetical protein